MGKLAYFIAGLATGVVGLLIAAYHMPEGSSSSEQMNENTNEAAPLNVEAEQEDSNAPSDPMPQQA